MAVCCVTLDTKLLHCSAYKLNHIEFKLGKSDLEYMFPILMHKNLTVLQLNGEPKRVIVSTKKWVSK